MNRTNVLLVSLGPGRRLDVKVLALIVASSSVIVAMPIVHDRTYAHSTFVEVCVNKCREYVGLSSVCLSVCLST